MPSKWCLKCELFRPLPHQHDDLCPEKRDEHDQTHAVQRLPGYVFHFSKTLKKIGFSGNYFMAQALRA